MIWGTLSADLETWFSNFPQLPKSPISIWTFHSSTAYLQKNAQVICSDLINLHKWAHRVTSPTQRNNIPVSRTLPLCPLLVTTSPRVTKGSVSVSSTLQKWNQTLYVCGWPLSVNVNFFANHPRGGFHSSSLLGHIPLSESHSVHSLPLLLMGMCALSIRGYLWNKAARNLLVHVFWWPSVCISVKCRPMAGLYGKCTSHFIRSGQLFQSACIILSSYRPCMRVSSGSPSCQLWAFSILFILAILVGA